MTKTKKTLTKSGRLSRANLMKRLDIVLLIVFPLASIFLSLQFGLNYLYSTLLFYGLPAAWLSIRTPRRVTKVLIFSLILAVPLAIFADYISIVSKAWIIPQTAFGFRVLGVVPVEDFILSFLSYYSIVIFYEHFLDKGKPEVIDKRMKYLILPLLACLLGFFVILLVSPQSLAIRYAYLWFGLILAIVPITAVLYQFPKLLSKYLKTAAYFMPVAMLNEFVALRLRHWVFPSNGYFVGWVKILGYSMPFEEFFFWIILSTIAILSFYEFFDDDRK